MEILKNLKKQIALLLLLISSFASNSLFAQCKPPVLKEQRRTVNSITVNWELVSGASSYRLTLYKIQSGRPDVVVSVADSITTNNHTFTNLDLLNNTYKIEAVSKCGNIVSPQSKELIIMYGPLIVDEVAMMDGNSSNKVESGSTNSISLKPECNELVSPTLRTPASITNSFTIENATNKKAYRIEIYSRTNELMLKLSLIREGDNKFVVKNEQCRIPSAGEKQVENIQWEYSDKYIIKSEGNGNIKITASGHKIKVYEANSFRVSSFINNTSPPRN